MVFDDIRRHMVREYEWADMPKEGMSDKEASHRQSLYAIMKRTERHLKGVESRCGAVTLGKIYPLPPRCGLHTRAVTNS